VLAFSFVHSRSLGLRWGFPFLMQAAIVDARAAEVAKRRAENVRALETKQQRLELEQFHRSEAVEAARREAARRQRAAEKLLADAHEASEREEAMRAQADVARREAERAEQLEAQRQRVEAARAEERERQLARDRQLAEQAVAAAAARAEEERRRLAEREATAAERDERAMTAILGRLDAAIAADRGLTDADTGSRRRARQAAADAQSALQRVKALESQLARARERSRGVRREKEAREASEDIIARFHVAPSSPEEVRRALIVGDGGASFATASENATTSGGTALVATADGQPTDASAAPAPLGVAGRPTWRSLQPLDHATWVKERAAEAELVSLSLEFEARHQSGRERIAAPTSSA
jgi:hypothetical protein